MNEQHIIKFNHNGLSIVINVYDGIIFCGLSGTINERIIIIINPVMVSKLKIFFDIFFPPFIYFIINIQKLHILNVVHFINVHKIILIGDVF